MGESVSLSHHFVHARCFHLVHLIAIFNEMGITDNVRVVKTPRAAKSHKLRPQVGGITS